MNIVFRWITGFIVGFEINPQEDVYFHCALGIFEFVIVSDELMENL